MNERRLLHLANNILPTVPAPKFDMGVWKCGTSACAVGWACSDKHFKEEGLKITENYGINYPAFSGVENWAAVEAFFGISFEDSKYLFAEESYDESIPVTAAKVSARIREFVAKGGE